MEEESAVQIPPSDEMNSLSLQVSSCSPPQMTLEERFRILRSVGEECTQEDELLNLLSNKPEPPICYDGFEPYVRMHIAEGVMKMITVNKMTSAGCKVKIYVADWVVRSDPNSKMGRDLKKIQTVGRYLIEIWKAAGMDLNGVEFLWASEEMNRYADYWSRVMQISLKTKVSRFMSDEQGRVADVFFRSMQCADILFLKADICQLGMDAKVIFGDYCDAIKMENKPIVLSQHMLPGLQQGQEKMSRTDLSSCIFMEDGEFKVERSAANGGDKTYTSHEELIADYAAEKLDSFDLKTALSKALNKILQPVRDHFNKDANAKDLLKHVKSYW